MCHIAKKITDKTEITGYKLAIKPEMTTKNKGL